MDGVIVYPLAATGTPPILVGDFSWQAGSLARLDESGMPSEPVIRKISTEIPFALESMLNRAHVDLWDTPIATSGMDVVGVEFCASTSALTPDVLLIHFTGANGIDQVNSLLGRNTQTSRDFRASLSHQITFHPILARGFAVLTMDGDEDDHEWSVHDGVFAFVTSQAKAQSMVHGRFAFALQVAATQFFALNMTLMTWPDLSDSHKEWQAFQSTISELSHSLVWPVISLNIDEQTLYRTARETFGIDATLSQVFADIDRRNQIVQADSAIRLNQLGTLVAISGLAAAWAGLAWAGAWTVAAGGAALTLFGFAWLRLRNRPLL